jgi:hypothetical protein
MGTTPTPGTGTGTMPGMGTTPTPGTGTGTMPGMGTTPTPGSGTGAVTQPPFIYGTTPGATTPPVGNGTPQPTSRTPLNPQSMVPPAQMNRNNQQVMPQTPMNNNHQAMPQTPMNMSPAAPNGVQTPSNGMAPMPGVPQQMPGMMPAPQPMQGGIPGTPTGIPGMQPGGNQEMPYYNPNLPYMSGSMPYMSYPPYQGIPNMYVPNTNSYNVPMGIPLFPLYGYDNSADLDHDVEYMKQLYPKTAKAIQREIDNECDQMEYDGSMMFDEYPDREYLEKLIDHVYDRIKQIEEEPQVEMNSLYFYPPRRNQNYLRDIVSLLLLSEIFNRRRRHRGRKRWF